MQYMGLRYPAFIESIVLMPPFITYPKRTKRDGIFEEVFENPLDGLYLDPNNWFVYAAKVGTALAYVISIVTLWHKALRCVTYLN